MPSLVPTLLAFVTIAGAAQGQPAPDDPAPHAQAVLAGHVDEAVVRDIAAWITR